MARDTYQYKPFVIDLIPMSATDDFIRLFPKTLQKSEDLLQQIWFIIKILRILDN